MRIFAICLIALGLVAGCATSSGGLRSASDRLDETSQMFYRQLAQSQASRSAITDAERFADATHEFHREVRDGRSAEVVAPLFDRVADSYHALRDQLDDREYGSRYREAGFDRVTDAYLDVERVMNRQYGRRYGSRD
ncbi:MAG: hypothetical protein M3O07_08600 [Pseudomonadota bacterium]|nr:hypothetical protein [Pseudomonadota bacterium]